MLFQNMHTRTDWFSFISFYLLTSLFQQNGDIYSSSHQVIRDFSRKHKTTSMQRVHGDY